MSAAQTGYTLVVSDETGAAALSAGYLVTDGGVLYATADRGATWRFYGLVDPEEFLLDLGFTEAFELVDADMAAIEGAARRFIAA